MLYLCLGTYLVVSIPLTVFLWTAFVAAKWGDRQRDIHYG